MNKQDVQKINLLAKNGFKLDLIDYVYGQKRKSLAKAVEIHSKCIVRVTIYWKDHLDKNKALTGLKIPQVAFSVCRANEPGANSMWSSDMSTFMDLAEYGPTEKRSMKTLYEISGLLTEDKINQLIEDMELLNEEDKELRK